jgi:hypothetical protein
MEGGGSRGGGGGGLVLGAWFWPMARTRTADRGPRAEGRVAAEAPTCPSSNSRYLLDFGELPLVKEGPRRRFLICDLQTESLRTTCSAPLAPL